MLIEYSRNLNIYHWPGLVPATQRPGRARSTAFIPENLEPSTMPLTKYQAVFFDVGGTLLKVHPSVGDVYARHARDFGFDGEAETLEAQFRVAWKESGGLESLGGQSGEAAEKKFWYDLVWSVFESYKLTDFDAYFARIYEAFRSAENWRVFDDVLDSGLLEKLKQRGVVLGVVSNWDSRLTSILENVGLAHYFDFILASAEVGSAKPDPGIFQAALSQSGIPASAACHIGDEIPTDVVGARSQGIDPILIDRAGRHNGDGRNTPTIKSFHELI